MAMIRNSIKKLAPLSRLSIWKRTVYSNWHLKDMNTLENMEDMRIEKYRDLWHRRAYLGPDELKPRSKQYLWNYESELFAFGKRFGEDFKTTTLRRAFLHSSYKPESEEGAAETEESEHTDVASTSNDEFVGAGEQIINDYTKAYVRYHFPRLPEEGIRAISAYLTSQEQLAYLANNLGMADLTLAADFPYNDETMAKTFKSIVGALKHDSGEQRAEYFVQDFVLTELVDLDVNEIFYVKDPMRILEATLKKQGKAAPESRIIRQTGVFTVTPTYIIGIYVDKQLLGQGPGESIDIAEDMAARDCLKTLWDTHMDRRLPLSFGPVAGRALDLAKQKTKENESLRSIIDFETESNLVESAVEEPFDLDEMHAMYKDEIEPTLGKVYRRNFKHYYYHGSIFKRNRRPFIAPSVKWI